MVPRKRNFRPENTIFAMTERFAAGKQDFYVKCARKKRKTLHSCFPRIISVSICSPCCDVERLAGKRTRRLYYSS